MSPSFCNEVFALMKFDQRVKTRVDLEDDVPSAAAAAAARAASRHVFFTAKRDDAVSTIAPP